MLVGRRKSSDCSTSADEEGADVSAGGSASKNVPTADADIAGRGPEETSGTPNADAEKGDEPHGEAAGLAEQDQTAEAAEAAASKADDMQEAPEGVDCKEKRDAAAEPDQEEQAVSDVESEEPMADAEDDDSLPDALDTDDAPRTEDNADLGNPEAPGGPLHEAAGDTTEADREAGSLPAAAGEHPASAQLSAQANTQPPPAAATPAADTGAVHHMPDGAQVPVGEHTAAEPGHNDADEQPSHPQQSLPAAQDGEESAPEDATGGSPQSDGEGPDGITRWQLQTALEDALTATGHGTCSDPGADAAKSGMLAGSEPLSSAAPHANSTDGHLHPATRTPKASITKAHADAATAQAPESSEMASQRESGPSSMDEDEDIDITSLIPQGSEVEVLCKQHGRQIWRLARLAQALPPAGSPETTASVIWQNDVSQQSRDVQASLVRPVPPAEHRIDDISQLNVGDVIEISQSRQEGFCRAVVICLAHPCTRPQRGPRDLAACVQRITRELQNTMNDTSISTISINVCAYNHLKKLCCANQSTHWIKSSALSGLEAQIPHERFGAHEHSCELV